MSVPLHPTPYADVNAVLSDFLARIRLILGDRFRGMYLDGSLALGDFNPQSSDIDFVVTTSECVGLREYARRPQRSDPTHRSRAGGRLFQPRGR